MNKPYYSIKEASEAFALSRSRVYVLLGQGDLKAVKAGRRTLITTESLEAFTKSLPAAQFGSAKAA